MDAHTSLFRFPRIQLERLSGQLRSYNIQGRINRTGIVSIAGAGIAVFAIWLIQDYRSWTAFGTGGTPATPAGYWRMTKIRIARMFAKDSLRDTSPLSHIGPKFLDIELPDKTKSRPKLQARTMPQRQLPKEIDPEVKIRVQALSKKYCIDNPDLLKLDLSHTEGKSTDGIYAKPDLASRSRNASAQDRILGNEIAHVHPAENSLHVWLSEPDARYVVARGWGERFPLGFVHPGFVFVYAPETMADVDVIEEIVEAGIAYVAGEKL